MSPDHYPGSATATNAWVRRFVLALLLVAAGLSLFASLADQQELKNDTLKSLANNDYFDTLFTRVTISGNIVLHLDAFNESLWSNRLLAYNAHARANYTVFPKRVYMGDENTAIGMGYQDNPFPLFDPTLAWAAEHGVTAGLTLRINPADGQVQVVLQNFGQPAANYAAPIKLAGPPPPSSGREIGWAAAYLCLLLSMGYASRRIFARWRESLVPGSEILLGSAAVAFGVFLFSLAGLKPGRSGLLSLFIVSLGLIFLFRPKERPSWFRWRRPKLTQLDWWQVPFLLLIGWGVVVAAYQAFGFPLTNLDAFGTWGFKAKMLTYASLPALHNYLHDLSLSYSHLDYPLLLPFLTAGCYAAVGAVNDVLGKGPLLLLYFAYIALMYAAGRAVLPRYIAVALTALAVAAPMVLHCALMGTADMPLAIFFAASLCYLVRWVGGGAVADLILCALFSIACAFTKNEGLAFAVINFTAAAAFGCRRSWPRFRAVAFVAAGAVVLLLPWLIFRGSLPHTDENYLGQLSISTITGNLNRLPLIAGHLFGRMFVDPNWRPAWSVIVVLTVAGFVKGRSRMVWTLFFVLLAQSAAYILAFLVTPYPLRVLLLQTVDRLLLHMLPVGMLLAAYSVAQFFPRENESAPAVVPEAPMPATPGALSNTAAVPPTVVAAEHRWVRYVVLAAMLLATALSLQRSWAVQEELHRTTATFLETERTNAAFFGKITTAGNIVWRFQNVDFRDPSIRTFISGGYAYEIYSMYPRRLYVADESTPAGLGTQDNPFPPFYPTPQWQAEHGVAGTLTLLRDPDGEWRQRFEANHGSAVPDLHSYAPAPAPPGAMAVCWVAAYLAVAACAGYALWRSLSTGFSRVGPGAAMILGAAAIGFALFWLSLAGVKPSRTVIVLLGVAALSGRIFANRGRHFHIPSFSSGRWTAFDACLLPFGIILVWSAVAVISQTFGAPYTFSDALGIWGLKAKALNTESLPGLHGFFHDLSLSSSHLDYPLLVPFLTAGAFAAGGEMSDTFAKMVQLYLFCAFGLLLYSACRETLGRVFACTLTALAVSAPVVLYWAVQGTADMPLTIFYAAGVVYTIRWIAGNDARDLWLAGLFSAACVFTKNEGLPLALINLAAAFIFGWKRNRRNLRAWAMACAGGLAILLPWLIFRSTLPHSDENYFGQLTIATLTANLGRLPEIFRTLGDKMFLTLNWGPICWLVAALFLAGLWRCPTRESLALAFTLIAQLAVYVLAYVITPYPVAALLDETANRLLMQTLPVGILLAAHGAAQLVPAKSPLPVPAASPA